jgi:hypothetical protein
MMVGGNKNQQNGGYYRPHYRPPLQRAILKEPFDNNQLSYYITIDLQLKPGTSLTPEQKKGLTCSHKWNKVSKSYSQLMGKPYNNVPDYSLLSQSQNQINRGGKTSKKRRLSKKVKLVKRKHNTRKTKKL